MWSCSIIWYSLTLDPWIFPVWTSLLFLLFLLLSSFNRGTCLFDHGPDWTNGVYGLGMKLSCLDGVEWSGSCVYVVLRLRLDLTRVFIIVHCKSLSVIGIQIVGKLVN